MPLSPFTGRYVQLPKPTAGLPGTGHGFNGESFSAGAEPGAQGTQMGIHHVENAKLDALAHDKVVDLMHLILPLRDRGAAGSAVRPVAIGVPRQ